MEQWFEGGIARDNWHRNKFLQLSLETIVKGSKKGDYQVDVLFKGFQRVTKDIWWNSATELELRWIQCHL